jgi:hypothetical protein
MAQPEGYYPRLNAQMVLSGNFNQMIVSLVGKVQGNQGTHVKFQCADGGLIRLSTEHGDIPALSPDAVVEIVGQVMGQDDVAVRSFVPPKGVGSQF